jgi:hypothetical protein
MWHRSKVATLVAAAALAGCGDGGVDPGDGGGDGIAERFEHLADSVDGEGYSPTAEALRHAADIVRLAGGATQVTLTIDGEPRGFLAVAEQIEFPNLVCSWPGDSSPGPGGATAVPDEAECEEIGTYSMRTLIAWEPENLAEVVRVVTDLGATEVQPGVPDVMTGLPTTGAPAGEGEGVPQPSDSVGLIYPGFIGEYLVRDVGSWWSVEGSQRNELVGSGGACTEDRATFDWARFACSAARFQFEVDMRVEPIRYEPLTGWEPDPAPGSQGPEGSHEIALATTEMAGVRLEVVEWLPPPVPPVDTVPVDPPPPVDPPVDPPPVDSSLAPGP